MPFLELIVTMPLLELRAIDPSKLALWDMVITPLRAVLNDFLLGLPLIPPRGAMSKDGDLTILWVELGLTRKLPLERDLRTSKASGECRYKPTLLILCFFLWNLPVWPPGSLPSIWPSLPRFGDWFSMVKDRSRKSFSASSLSKISSSASGSRFYDILR